MDGRLLPCGESAVLVEVADLDAVLALDAVVRPLVEGRAPGWRQVVDVVPAARTLLVTLARPADLPRLSRLLAAELAAARTDVPPSGAVPARTVVIPVVYDGPDLADVGRLTGLGEAEVIAAHTGRPWRAAFGGFAPGFTYLVGGDPRLEVPRRTEPRTAVPAGAVGLAGAFSGCYPRSSPGGWQLVGRTDAVLWDVDRTPPALLPPGVLVQFVRAT